MIERQKDNYVGKVYETMAKEMELSASFLATQAPTNPMYQYHYEKYQYLRSYFGLTPETNERKSNT